MVAIFIKFLLTQTVIAREVALQLSKSFYNGDNYMRIYKVSGYFTWKEAIPMTTLLNYLTNVLLFFYEVMFINLKIILIALYAASMCGLLPIVYHYVIFFASRDK